MPRYVQSLLACFNERGYVETTLDQVATDVGIGKGTLYRHYSSREDLFEAALRAGIEALMDRCRGISETHAADFDAAFRALIVWAFRQDHGFLLHSGSDGGSRQCACGDKTRR